MISDWNKVSVALSSIVMFRNVVQQEPLIALRRFLDLKTDDTAALAEAYSTFVSALFAKSHDFGLYLQRALFEDENEYVIARAHGKTIPTVIQRCVENELVLFSELSSLNPKDLAD